MKKIIQLIPVFSLLTVVFLTYANTVDDLDLWWHLKSGQVIYETREIPGRDEFAYTSYLPEHISGIGTENQEGGKFSPEEISEFLSSGFIKRNWGSQLLLYLSYLSGGFIGTGILKSFIFTGAFVILYLAMRKRGAGQWSALLVLCLVAYIAGDFNYTRPQLFSFLFFAGMLYVLYDFKRGGKSIYFLPLLMMIWANMHGGIILGVVVILAFAGAEVLKYVLHSAAGIASVSPLRKSQIRILAVVVAVSAAASLISPAGHKTFIFPWVLDHSLFGTIEEYHRPMLYEYHAYWGMLLLVAVSILFRTAARRLDLTELLLCLTVIIPSLKSNKYIIYFALGAAVFLAGSMTYAGAGIANRDLYRKFLSITRLSKVNLKDAVSVLLAAASLIAVVRIAVFDDVLQFDMREKRYPAEAVDFIKENGIEGNMFNPFNWGGYLVWRLYPEHKVFIYGRAVNETAFFHYNRIMSAADGSGTEDAVPLWKRLLDVYNVNFILTGALSSNGRIVPLVDSLYEDGRWALIYQDGTSMIFLRTSERNYDMLHAHYLSKEKIYDQIISEGTRGIAETPATWGYYETLGYVYMKRNRFRDALVMFEKYLSMNPYNQKVRRSYELLRRYTGRH